MHGQITNVKWEYIYICYWNLTKTPPHPQKIFSILLQYLCEVQKSQTSNFITKWFSFLYTLKKNVFTDKDRMVLVSGGLDTLICIYNIENFVPESAKQVQPFPHHPVVAHGFSLFFPFSLPFLCLLAFVKLQLTFVFPLSCTVFYSLAPKYTLFRIVEIRRYCFVVVLMRW